MILTGECEPVTIAMCQNISYKLTRFPNAFQHGTQKLAARKIQRFSRLVMSSCSPLLATFLCSVYAPPCDESHKVIPPCKDLCKDVTKSCKRLIRRLRVPWPSELQCKRFPTQGQSPCLKVSAAKTSQSLPVGRFDFTFKNSVSRLRFICRFLRTSLERGLGSKHYLTPFLHILPLASPKLCLLHLRDLLSFRSRNEIRY